MQQIWRKAVRQRIERASRWSLHLAGMLVVTVLVLTSCVAHAQIAGTANIQGTVTDSTGAVVASGSVVLTDEATQVKRTTVSDGSGVYLFPAIPIGTYDLKVTASGFKTYEQKGIILEVGSSISINPPLCLWAAESRRSKSRQKGLRCRQKTQHLSKPSTTMQ